MLGRLAVRPPNHLRTRIARFIPVLGLLASAGLVSAAQPPSADDRDNRAPRPVNEQTRPLTARKYQVPNKDRAIFQGHRDPKTGFASGGITDFEHIAKETTNKLEYDAWHEITLHAAQFSARELEDHAAWDVTREELTGADRAFYRLELLRYDGKVTQVRRFSATMSLRESGTLEMYEAFLVPLDEPPTGIVSIIFTELPVGLAAVGRAPEEQWVSVDQWAVAAGYFFKAVREAPGTAPFPLLIGKSIRLLDEPPAGPDPRNPAAIDKTLRVFGSIRNDAPMASGDENWKERVAWNRVLLHARRFSAEELDENARADLTFSDLFNDGRWIDKDGRKHYDGQRDYKLELVRFEGRLKRLQRMTPSRELRDAGVETAYEAWLVPKGEPSGNPICIVFTEPIEGVEPGANLNQWVSFAGYVFKLLRYESGEKDRDDSSRYTWKRAPLLLGRAAIIRPDPEAASPVSWKSFMTAATIVVGTFVGAALGLNWWYRRGDRSAQREIEAHRARNPFGEVGQ